MKLGIGITSEPAIWSAAIRQIVLLSVLFGFKLTAEQISGIMIAVESILALFTRQVVTPNNKL